LSSGRNEQIEGLYGDIAYKSVAHVHITPVLLGEELVVVGHGIPTSNGLENCAMAGSECQGTGSDTECERGKCGVGTLSRVSGDRWRYDSLTVPGLYYFVFGTDKITLRSITRGKFSLPAGAGTVNVPRVASIPATIYLPPNTYLEETFTRRVIKTRYSDSVTVRSLTDSADNFTRALLGTDQATVRVETAVRDRLLDTLQSLLDPAWYEFVSDSIYSIWNVNLTNREFAIEAYGALTELYGSGVEVMMSGIQGSRVSVDDRIGRPVYGRLPGVEGTYNNPDEPDTPAKWLTSGADDMLSGTKHIVDNFYRTYLNPDTCYPPNLDWLAQHLGFVGGLWNLEWSNSTKRLLLSNAHVNRVSGSMWTQTPSLDTLRRIDMGRIERVQVNSGTGVVTTAYRYSGRVYNTTTDLTTVGTFNNLVVDVSRWQGILPSRGSTLTLLFMLWALGIKAHTPEELRYDPSTGTFVVRSGLRDRELNAPINVPYIVDVLRAGTDTDAEVSNYPNQLIAGIGTCQDELSANTTVVRMPFYYNRNGRSWDSVVSVMDNYAPSTSINRVQYAYSVADLLVADDVFFEPEVVS
jgi:P2-related tail formation protein